MGLKAGSGSPGDVCRGRAAPCHVRPAHPRIPLRAGYVTHASASLFHEDHTAALAPIAALEPVAIDACGHRPATAVPTVPGQGVWAGFQLALQQSRNATAITAVDRELNHFGTC